MRTARMVLVLVVAVLIASPLLAKEAKKKVAAKPARCPADQQICKLTEGMTLTAEQKAKFDALKKEFGPKIVEAKKKVEGVLTPEQKKARSEAQKKAKAEGKTGKDLQAALDAAMKLTDEQKAKQAEARKAVNQLTKDLDKAARAVLTDEQKATLKKKADAAKKPKKAK